jgi:hypothetical protein
MATTRVHTISNGLAAASLRSTSAISHSVRVIAVVSALAVATLGLPAVQASAQDDRPADPGVRCAAKIAPGEYEFYLPGAKVTDINGNKWVCGPDGQWFRDYSALTGRNLGNVHGSLGEISLQASPGKGAFQPVQKLPQHAGTLQRAN